MKKSEAKSIIDIAYALEDFLLDGDHDAETTLLKWKCKRLRRIAEKYIGVPDVTRKTLDNGSQSIDPGDATNKV